MQIYFSLCTRQLSLYFGLIKGQNNSLQDPSYPQSEHSPTAIPTAGLVRRRGEGAAAGSLALQAARLFLPSGKFSACAKPELPRLRLPPFPLFRVSTFCGQCDAQLTCDDQLKILCRAGAKLFPWLSPGWSSTSNHLFLRQRILAALGPAPPYHSHRAGKSQ